jgi:hypothetical protein
VAVSVNGEIVEWIVTEGKAETVEVEIDLPAIPAHAEQTGTEKSSE